MPDAAGTGAPLRAAAQAPGGRLVVAGLSARLMAEVAATDGFDVLALDCFGDADTLAAARAGWQAIGQPGVAAIDPLRLRQALNAAALTNATAPPTLGWVPGPGLEACVDQLLQAPPQLPLLGTQADVMARLRDPTQFFGFLAAHGADHPDYALVPVVDARGWLVKQAGGSGGWHIRLATSGQPLAAGEYLQRTVAGQPMSATFLANGHDTLLLGVNHQRVRPLSGRPHVYCGVVGPVPVADALRAQLQGLLAALTREFGLRGLGSLDFLRDGARLQVLELNPRPSASMALYRHWRPMAAHVRACLSGDLPGEPPAPPAERAVQGHEIIFARRPLRLRAGLARRLAGWPGVHDQPHGGQRFAPGEPVCSLGVGGATLGEVLRRLAQGRKRLLTTLEASR